MNIAERIINLANTLDATGKACAPITTRSTREYLMRLGIAPADRGELMIGGHLILVRAKSDEDEE